MLNMEKERTFHLFRVPNHWTNNQIKELSEKLSEALKNKQGLIAKKEVEYTPIPLIEGEMFEVKRFREVI